MENILLIQDNLIKLHKWSQVSRKMLRGRNGFIFLWRARGITFAARTLFEGSNEAFKICGIEKFFHTKINFYDEKYFLRPHQLESRVSVVYYFFTLVWVTKCDTNVEFLLIYLQHLSSYAMKFRSRHRKCFFVFITMHIYMCCCRNKFICFPTHHRGVMKVIQQQFAELIT